MLTDLKCRQAQPADKPRKLADERGLYLLITTSGGKLWRFDYRHQDKRKTLALGAYPDVSLARARARRDEARALVAEGIDPGAARKEAEAKERERGANTFERVARAWHQKNRADWVPAYAEKVLTSLEQDIFPTLGARPIAEIQASELLAALRKIEQRGALETLKRVRQRCSDVFLFAIAEGKASNNPAAGLHKAVQVKRARHRPALQVSELRDFFIRLDAVRVSALVKLAIRLQVLTFVRPGELRCAEWKEVDLERAEWNIPGERDRARGLTGMKMKEPHAVPLSSQAVALFAELRDLTGHHSVCFPNRNGEGRPMSDGTVNQALRAMGYSRDQVTGSGFRATATGALLELGFKPEVIDRQLAHRERSEVFGAYSHQAQYMVERRKLMQAWGDFVSALGRGATIIPIKAARESA